jgi:GNAT superfamily N-acetyltransferase
MYVSEQDLQDPIPEVKPPIELEIGIATIDDLRSIEDRMDGASEKFFHGDKEFFLAAVKRGNTCFVAKTNGQIAGYTWVNFHDVPLFFDAVARYPRDTAHTFNALVFPEYRGKKVFQAISRELYTYLKSQGYRYACNLISRNNVPAIRAKQTAGARVQMVRFTKLPYCQLKVSGPRRFELVSPSAQNPSQT